MVALSDWHQLRICGEQEVIFCFFAYLACEQVEVEVEVEEDVLLLLVIRVLLLGLRAAGHFGEFDPY